MSTEKEQAGTKIASVLSEQAAKDVVAAGNRDMQKVAAKVAKIVSREPSWYERTWVQHALNSVATITLLTTFQSCNKEERRPFTPATEPTPVVQAATNAFNATDNAQLSVYSMSFLMRDPANTNSFVYVAPAKSLAMLSEDGLKQHLSDIGSSAVPQGKQHLVFAKNESWNDGRTFIIPHDALKNPAALQIVNVAVTEALEDVKNPEFATVDKIGYRFDYRDGKISAVRDFGNDKRKADAGNTNDMAFVFVYPPPAPAP